MERGILPISTKKCIGSCPILILFLFAHFNALDFYLSPLKIHSQEISTITRRIRNPYLSLARSVFAHYDLGEVLEARRFELGYVNEPLYIRITKGEYVLRSSREVREVEELQFDYSLLDYLRNQGFPAPYIYHARDGNFYVEVEGIKYLVYEYFPFEQPTWGDFKDERLKSIAKVIAWYHSLVKDFIPEGRKERLSITEDLDNIKIRLESIKEFCKEKRR